MLHYCFLFFWLVGLVEVSLTILGMSTCFLALLLTLLFWVALYYVRQVNLLWPLVEYYWCDSKGLLPLSKMIDSGTGAKIKFALNGKVSMLDKAVEQIKQVNEES